jgi:hypothetical protein
MFYGAPSFEARSLNIIAVNRVYGSLRKLGDWLFRQLVHFGCKAACKPYTF